MKGANRKTVVVAHPNIALAKYWGKCAWPGKYPAVPSLSVTLSGMETRTTIDLFDSSQTKDEFVLNGKALEGEAAAKSLAPVRALLTHAGISTFARVESNNDFPTGSGLASSASGFAALALAAVRACGVDVELAHVSDIARQHSASAARSVFGGFAELPAGARGEGFLAARPVAPPSQLPLCVLVCVATENAKSTSSSLGMQITQEKSPYYGAWLNEAPRLFDGIKEALLTRDFETMGALSEASALAMHASALAANVAYFSGVTLAALTEVKNIRRDGVHAFATIDAGPHVKVLVLEKDVAVVKERMAKVPGVLRVVEARPGEGARVVEAIPC